MRKMLVYIAVTILLFASAGCDDIGKDYVEKERAKTEQMMNEAMRQIGMPNITNFFQKRTLKTILEKADQSILTYSYTFNHFTGKFRYIGRSVGYGVPFSAQYTNPYKVEKYWETAVVINQPDPNGLYMPTSSSATWILLIDDNTGEINLTYIEPPLTVSEVPLPAHIADYPPGFWEKYNSGKYDISPSELKEKVRRFEEKVR